MLSSTPNTEYVSRRPRRRELSPSRHDHRTPPRPSARPTSFHSPMFSSSPLKRCAMPVDSMDEDDVFSSPMPSGYKLGSYKENPARPRSNLFDTDDDDAIFLAPRSPSHSRTLFPPSSSPMPLRTPVKQGSSAFETPARPVFSVAPTNSPFPTTATAGTKRKPAPIMFATPERRSTFTPLNVTSSASDLGEDAPLGFERLAPLPAPSFVTRTPQTKGDAEAHLKKQADSMRRMKIQDRDQSGEESGYDSGSEVRECEVGRKLFVGGAPSSAVKSKKSPGLALLIGRAVQNDDEVVESMSPGGHVNKRRARSRPVSAELLAATPAPRNNENVSVPTPILDPSKTPSATSGTIAFPSLASLRERRSSASSSSSMEVGSPRRRTRLTSGSAVRALSPPKRAPLNRLTSVSSATLFFGPSIPQPEQPRSKKASDAMSIDVPPGLAARPKAQARHSYAGNTTDQPWYKSSSHSEMSEEELFFSSPPHPSGFSFSDAPSPTKKQRVEPVEKLQKKFRPRDSGIVVDGDDSDDDFIHRSPFGAKLLALSAPRPSGSLSSVQSQSESDGEALVTPGVGPGPDSGWPSIGIAGHDDELDSDSSAGVDAFILRTLTANTKPSAPVPGEPQRIPGTPVKKVKTSHLLERPWQSAVAHKIGFPEFDEPQEVAARDKKSKPRKSLPAAFPGLLSARPRKEAVNIGALDAADEDEEASPSMRKDAHKNRALTLGRPPVPLFAKSTEAKTRTRWLMRRSSSGAFSSGSETTTSRNATPTRIPAKEWQLPAIAQQSPLSKMMEEGLPMGSQESTSSAVSEASTAMNSPTVEAVARHFPSVSPKKAGHATAPRPSHPRATLFPGSALRGRIPIPSGEERPGRFERDFVEIDELGRGEFGRVMKARYKESSDVMFAVKKSKRFEGVKHRQRLREEVDILKHLSRAACSAGWGDRHPNVLGYTDSWEEDETLYIQTELCALGNFSHFLWEYGRTFPRLDEARVWKIFAELSSGLDFIHHAGVIHLDLKPANIFVTEEGRFKIGDFGMASIWPRPALQDSAKPGERASFEREGDKLYLAPEVLQGKYGFAADIFSFGMTMLETATNIVVPDQGEAWHRLRNEDFSQVDFSDLSDDFVSLLKSMMRSDPSLRVDADMVAAHPVLVQVRDLMEALRNRIGSGFQASALAGAPDGWLEEILGHSVAWDGDEGDEAMDFSP